MKHSILLFACCIAFSSLAQEVEKTEFNKNELSVSFSDVFNSFRASEYPGIIYKRHFANGALRTRLNFNFSNQSLEVSNPSTDTITLKTDVLNETNTFGLEFSLGYQWNRHISKNLIVFYGADAFVQTSSSERQLRTRVFGLSGALTSVQINTNETSNLGFGLSPVLGFRYHIGKSFALGMENIWRAGFTSTEVTVKNEFRSGNSVSIITDSNNPTSFGFSLQPTTLLVVGYYF